MAEDARQHELLEKLKAHAVLVSSLRELCTNEEQTKVSLINPYLEHLGFNVRDPRHVKLEYRSDIGSGTERVDYALLKEGRPVLLIEAKAANSELPPKATEQLRRYAMALPELRHCAITNGIHWQWYAKSASKDSGDLDPQPFLVHDATAPVAVEVEWLASLRDDPQHWDGIATEQNLQTKIGDWFVDQCRAPDRDFIVSIIRGVDETNNQKTRDTISRIWKKTITLHVQKEIDKALSRAATDPEERINPPVIEPPDSVGQNTTEKEFRTAEGTVRIDSGSLKRAWRKSGEERWTIEPNMTALCREIYLNLYRMHDPGMGDFFAQASRGLSDDRNKSRWIQRKCDLSPEQLKRKYTELTPDWCFLSHASNRDKIHWLREIAQFCISSGKSIVLDDHFEIWDPRMADDESS